MTRELEVAVAEMIHEMVPAMEMIRFACSGTEATMHAIRLARAYTGREIILKFEGNYHGFQDYTLWSTYAPVEAYGNRRSPIPVPASSGIPKALRELVITLPFNDFEGFERAMRSYGDQIAAVITEAMPGQLWSDRSAARLPGSDPKEKPRSTGRCSSWTKSRPDSELRNGGAQEKYQASFPTWQLMPRPWATAIRSPLSAASARSCPSSGMAWRRAGPTPEIDRVWPPPTQR